MSPVWVAFFAGALVWVPAGVFLMALAVAAGRADEDADRTGRNLRP